MLHLHFPIPPTINTSLSIHHIHRKKSTQYCSGRSRALTPGAANDFAESWKKNSSLARFRWGGGSKCAAAGGTDHDNEKHRRIELPGSLDPELIPKHVAVIMDGNRRWAVNRGYPVQVGHRAGGEALKRLSRSCRRFGVQVLSVFAFSTENWVRPKEEVEYLMKLFEESVRPRLNLLERDRTTSGDGRLSVIGNRTRLPLSLQNLMAQADKELAEHKKGLHLVVACNYSGRYDITEATKKIATKVQGGALKVEDIDENLFEQRLETNGVDFPNPDLLIRTSGEQRISNFMLWQLAHTELFFSNKLFPDFDEADFVKVLAEFQRRQR